MLFSLTLLRIKCSASEFFESEPEQAMAGVADQRKVDQAVLRLTTEDASALLVERILVTAAQRNRRILVGIAGAPGVGKSTMTANVIGILNQMVDGSAARVPMDGFYMPKEKLERLGIADRRGAPESFDAAGYVALLERLKRTKEPLPIPSFSRRRNDVMPKAFTIASNVPIIVAEGSYLLLEMAPWDHIRELLDLCFFVTAPRTEVHKRLRARPLPDDRTERAEAIEHIENVELPSFDIAQKTANRADLIFELLHDSKLMRKK